MYYRYDTTSKTTHTWKDNSNSKWGYIKKKPQHYVADAYKKSRVTSKEQLILNNQKLEVEPSKKRLGVFEKVVGYIPCVDETNQKSYIRIISFAPLRLLVCLVIFTALVGGGLYYFKQSLTPADDTPIKIKAGQIKNTDPTNIMLPGIDTMYVAAGKTRVNQPLLNVEGNAYDLTYTIALEKTGEVIYTSKSIQPGYGVKQFDLNRTFKKGIYPVTITVDSSAQQDRKKKDKNKQVAYNSGRLHATLIAK